MWRTPSSTRTLSGPEAELVRAAITDMTDSLHDEADGLADEWPCGVRLFDELSWQQRLALLARVAKALFKPEVPAPELSAVNEATVAAIFAQIQRNIVIELDNAKDTDLPPDFDICYWRRLIAACQEPLASEDDFFVEVQSADLDDWETLIECLSDGILWDGDWGLPELFLDAAPETSRARRRRLGIERDYFTTPAPDPRDEEVPAIFQDLHQLLDGTR
jgi:hypothetical protein